MAGDWAGSCRFCPGIRCGPLGWPPAARREFGAGIRCERDAGSAAGVSNVGAWWAAGGSYAGGSGTAKVSEWRDGAMSLSARVRPVPSACLRY